MFGLFRQYRRELVRFLRSRLVSRACALGRKRRQSCPTFRACWRSTRHEDYARHAPAIDGARNARGADRLRFGDLAREYLPFGVGAGPGDFACERRDLFGQYGIGLNRQAQPVTQRVARREGAALFGLRASAGASVGAVGLSCVRWSRRVFSFVWRRLDLFKLAVLDLLHTPSQSFAKVCPAPIDLAQAGVAAASRPWWSGDRFARWRRGPWRLPRR